MNQVLDHSRVAMSTPRFSPALLGLEGIHLTVSAASRSIGVQASPSVAVKLCAMGQQGKVEEWEECHVSPDQEYLGDTW
jgi:hypothetical protein